MPSLALAAILLSGKLICVRLYETERRCSNPRLGSLFTSGPLHDAVSSSFLCRRRQVAADPARTSLQLLDRDSHILVQQLTAK